MRSRFATIVGIFTVLNPYCLAFSQPAESVGIGSVAASLPETASTDGTSFQKQPLFWNLPPGTPVPTNEWWSDALFSRFSGSLWAFPFKVETSEAGVSAVLPVRWMDHGRDLLSEYPFEVGGRDFTARDTRVEAFGDWTLTLTQAGVSGGLIRTTIGRGMPYVWMEFEDVSPTLKFRRDIQPQVKGPSDGRNGFVTSEFLLRDGDRMVAVVAPRATRFTPSDDGVWEIAFAGEARYLVLGAVPALRDFDLVVKHARAVPTASALSWSLDRRVGVVRSTWTVTTRPIDPDGTGAPGGEVLQGWLPHHLRDTAQDFELVSPSYLTPRGTMRTTVGNTFRVDWPFRGVLPAYPMPDRVPRETIDRLLSTAMPGDMPADTYWGGKALLDLTRFMWLAHTTGHPDAEALGRRLREELVDWYTYTPASRVGPGETERYFARYPGMGALVGIKPSYGSDKFNDHHFHYGYFAYASAVLGLHDPGFLEDYGEIARLVAHEYANPGPPEGNPQFPKLRNLDPWAGHSWAGGTSSPGGNNQESSSEAVMSWIGLYLLGVALDDESLTSTGALGYAMETRATMEYWFDVHGENWSDHYKHPVVGILWSGGQQYATYFTADPAWIHAIQWIPAMPGMSYLAPDDDFVQEQLRVLRRDRQAKEGSGKIEDMGVDLGKLVLGFEALADPTSVLKQIDRLRRSHEATGNSNGIKLVEADALSRRALGREVDSAWSDAPLSRVFVGRNGKKQLIAWNPEKTEAVIVDGDREIEVTLSKGWSATPIPAE